MNRIAVSLVLVGCLLTACVLDISSDTGGIDSGVSQAATTAAPTATPTALPTNTAVSLVALRAALPTTTPGVLPIVPTVIDLGILATPTALPPTATRTPLPLPIPVITQFTTSAASVDAAQLATRDAILPVTWAVENRASGTNLVFDQIFPDGRTFNVELPRGFVTVSSTGNGFVNPYLPGGDSQVIRLRLRVVYTATGRTLAARDLTVPVTNQIAGAYTVVDAASCYTLPFRPSMGFAQGVRGIVGQNVNAHLLPVSAIGGIGGRIVGSLQPGETFVVTGGPFCFRSTQAAQDGQPVTYRQWQVRSERTGLTGWVYEYSGTYIRATLYIGLMRRYVTYAMAQCYDAPFLPDRGIRVGYGARTADWVHYGLSLYDKPQPEEPSVLETTLSEDEIFTVIAGPVCFREEPAPQPMLGYRQWKVRSEISGVEGWLYEYSDQYTAVIVPASDGTEGTGVEIVAFDVQPRTVDAGGTLTITWEVRGTNGVTINMWHDGLESGKVPLNGSDLLPPTGSLTVSAPTQVTSARFTVFEPFEGGITVTIRCASGWFAAAGSGQFCPNNPARSVEAAYQPFENGFMIWFENRIWAFYNHSGMIIRDTWTSGDVVYPEAPPDGRFQPVRGFGTAWVQDSSLRTLLGWATAPEQGYTARVQNTDMIHRPGLRGGYDAADYLLTLPDGRVIALTATGTGFNWEDPVTP